MWQKITIDFKEKLEEYTRKKIQMCDYSFTNLYLWSFGDDIEYREENEVLFLRGNYASEEDYFMPLDKHDNMEEVKKAIDKLVNQGKKVKYISKEVADYLESYYEIEEMENSFDYVYLVEDLAFLKGRKYSKKKNKISQFTKGYNFAYEKIQEENIEKVIQFQKSWNIKKNNEENESLKSENEGIENILKNYWKLSLVGGILTVDGNVIGYTIGEKLTEDMAVIHIEKADEVYNGSYQAINNFFLQQEWLNFKFVNREDDSGVPGIRQAKESYFPIKRIKKYMITGKR